MKLSLLPVIALLFVTGCATSPKIQVVQAGDNKMSCEQLEEDLKKLDEASASVQGKKALPAPMSQQHYSGCRVWPTPTSMQARH